MLKEFKYRIKVNASIKTVPRSLRIIPELKLGDRYFVSFGNNWAYPCDLITVINKFEQPEVKIRIRLTDKNASFASAGKLLYDLYQEHVLYANEIGACPEDAVRNCV